MSSQSQNCRDGERAAPTIAEPSGPRLLSPKIVAGKVGISVRTLQRMVRDGLAPMPVQISPGRVGFYEHEVMAWLSSLPRTRVAAADTSGANDPLREGQS